MRPSNFPINLVNTRPSDNNSLRLRLGSFVPVSLQNLECPFNWLQLYHGHPLSLSELDHGVLILEEKCRDESQEDVFPKKQKDSDEIFRIARKFTQAQFNMELQRWDKSKQNLTEVEKLITEWQENNPNPDYFEGFLYILEGMKIFRQIQMTTNPPVDANKVVRRKNTPQFALDGHKHFKRLPAKAKYIVWTVRDIFILYCSRANVERSDWMSELLLEMEPYTPKWHFYLYRALHGRRKLVPRPLPLLLLTPDEAKDHSGEDDAHSGGTSRILGGGAGVLVDDDPLSISYQCMCLAQMFAEKQSKINAGNDELQPLVNQYYPWRFAHHTFETPDQVLECVRDKTIFLIEMDCHLDGVYVNLSEVHMFMLPLPYRSTELAVRCLKKSLRLQSANAKTHYRMGLAQYKLSNNKQAVHHFREAISRNPSNLGAAFGLLQLLLANPVDNALEIQQIFRTTVRNLDLIRIWDKRCLRTLHYLKGCYHFMMLQTQEASPGSPASGEDCLNEAITSWIIAHDNGSHKWSYYFLNLAEQSSQFRWPTKKLNLTNVSNALKHAAYLEQTQFRQLLLDICAEVDDAICRDSERKGK